MLDSIGVNRLLGLQSVASLWDADAHLAHFTSALRYPVFIDGKNYSGAPPLLATPLLREQFLTSSSPKLRRSATPSSCRWGHRSAQLSSSPPRRPGSIATECWLACRTRVAPMPNASPSSLDASHGKRCRPRSSQNG
jgi:hypothetical protein